MSDLKKMNSRGSEQENVSFEHEELSINSKPSPSGFLGKAFLVLIIIIIILGGLYVVSKYTAWNVLNVSKVSEESKGWEAVFLTNGQVYFGRIVKQTNNNIELKNIYYLQVTRQLQPAPNAQTDTAANQEQQQLSLVKLGDELHGPTDNMVINRSQVLFTEQLKEDSKVVDAIKRYIEDQANKK